MAVGEEGAPMREGEKKDGNTEFTEKRTHRSQGKTRERAERKKRRDSAEAQRAQRREKLKRKANHERRLQHRKKKAAGSEGEGGGALDG
jgi:hypothetical protein